MSVKKNSSLDRVLGHLDDLDSVNMSNLVERLIRERQLQETVFNTIQDGILVVDSSGIIQYANSRGCKLIGLKDKDIGSSVLWKLVPDLYSCLNINQLDGRNESVVISREVELTYPEHRFVRLYVLPIVGCIGVNRDNGYAIVMSDTTEDKLTTEERIESEKVSSVMMLAATVAHEIGNPLNSINIHMQLMKRQLENVDKESEAYSKIASSVDVCTAEVERLDGIINNFLEAIRPSEPDLVDTDLLVALEEVLRVQEEEFSNKKIEVDVQVADTLPLVMADKNQIKQVFFNVINNALEAMEAKPRLKIFTGSDDEFVFFQFVDSGKGISKEDMQKIFQPYYTSKKGGHGLGMMIVQRIMRDHGGQIGIDSKEGLGTVITLQFPQKHRRIRLLEASQ